MPANQKEVLDTNHPTAISHSEPPNHSLDRNGRAPSSSPGVVKAKTTAQFRFRILVVDDEPSLRETAGLILESEGYEVLTAIDGVEGLHVLGKSLPDLIISDLNMPRMSGFEFLAIVRERFPRIATIAMSGGYGTGEMPPGILADAFVQKASHGIKELSRQVARLLAASPIRSERKKNERAPVFLPRDSAGYLTVSCPNCLRHQRLEAIGLNGGLHQTTCQLCGTLVTFEIEHNVEPLVNPKLA
jgi:CheY-like chemotaxis protein